MRKGGFEMKLSFSTPKSVVAIAVLAFSVSACGKHESNKFIYMPDMVYSPAVKSQQGIQRLPVEGTVPRGFERYEWSSQDPELTVKVGSLNLNPLPVNAKTLARGKQMFNTYCIVCHGPAGEGDGTIVPRFPRPPSLQSDKVRGYKDGSIFHVITMGQNLMPSYASQIQPQDRWAIIHYVRALQRSKHPTPQDLKEYEQEQARLQQASR